MTQLFPVTVFPIPTGEEADRNAPGTSEYPDMDRGAESALGSDDLSQCLVIKDEDGEGGKPGVCTTF